MKILITTVILLAGSLIAFAQPSDTPKAGAELQIGYYRETFKMRDLQTSPMMYIANLNGLQVSYTRITPKNQWHAGIKFGLADFTSPKLGIRSFKFSADQSQPMVLVPTLYKGGLEVSYKRLIRKTANRYTWIGIGLEEKLGYADGIAMTTWEMNTAAISLLYQTQLFMGQKHALIFDASLPVATAVSRISYSNVVSAPNQSNVKTFFQETRMALPHRFLNPQVNLAYRLGISKRLAFQATYQYNYMRYPEPRLIRTASHIGNLSLVYQFQFQYK